MSSNVLGMKKLLSMGFELLFSLDENIFQKFLGDDAVGSGWTLGGSLIEPTVNSVELWTKSTSHVEPPIADEDCLTKLCSIWTEEGCLSTVNVAIVPGLTPRLDVGEKSRIRLIITVEVRVGHFAQNRIVSAWPTYKK